MERAEWVSMYPVAYCAYTSDLFVEKPNQFTATEVLKIPSQSTIY